MAEAVEPRVIRSLRDVPQQSWDALLRPDDNPFVSWSFLEALESSGSVSPRRGWLPCHLTVWSGDRLLAAAPAYVKGDGMGDFSRDWAFGHALTQLGGALYPKLVLGVPFSPVSGRRLLIRAGIDPGSTAALILELAQRLAREHDLAAIQVLYHDQAESPWLEAAGFSARALIQYHWHNRAYESVENWLADLASKRRTQIRRERREPSQQGIALRTVTGEELLDDPQGWARRAFQLYESTCSKYMWGGTYLTPEFFARLLRRMPRTVRLVLAERAGEIVAGAINIATPTHLFGRYWGCFEEHRFLHFNVCLYHGIEECITEGRSTFEGGAGGEHKLARGFEPVLVHTAHWFAQDHVRAALAPALRADWQARAQEVASWQRSVRPSA